MTLLDAITHEVVFNGGVFLCVMLPVVVAFTIGRGWLSDAGVLLSRLAERRTLCVAIFTIAPLLIRVVLLPWDPIPTPRIHDEFSHLLVADTIASGRFANPTHPHWRHFETIYVFQQPQYASIYPPGVGAVMAIGQRLFGHPWWGMQLASALMCGAVCWLLYALVPPVWALAGSVLAAARFGNFSYFADSYMGGASTALGGALVIGGLLRFVESGRRWHAFLMAAGWALVWLARPYESVVVGGGAALLVIMLRIKRGNWRNFLPAAIRGAAPVVLMALALTAVHNWKVTGHPLQLPYRLSQTMFGVPAGLVWQELPPPTQIRNDSQQNVYEFQRDAYSNASSNFIGHVTASIGNWFHFYLSFLLVPPVIACLRAKPAHPWLYRLLLWYGVAWLASAFYPFYIPHYHAAYVPVVLLVVIEGIRLIWARSAELALILLLCGCVTGLMKRLHEDRTDRSVVESQVTRQAGRHLVFVRYGKDHSFHDEWVYNRAQIDDAHIVWAREVNPASDSDLMEYFSDRTIWRVDLNRRQADVTRLRDARPRPVHLSSGGG